MEPAAASTNLTAPLTLTSREALTRELAEKMIADETMQEIDEDELAEFLAADHDPVAADPAFREQLREQLWALVQAGVTTRPKNH